MSFIINAPHDIPGGFALKGRHVPERRNILADVLRVAVVLLELQPGSFVGQLAELGHQSV